MNFFIVFGIVIIVLAILFLLGGIIYADDRDEIPTILITFIALLLIGFFSISLGNLEDSDENTCIKKESLNKQSSEYSEIHYYEDHTEIYYYNKEEGKDNKDNEYPEIHYYEDHTEIYHYNTK